MCTNNEQKETAVHDYIFVNPFLEIEKKKNQKENL